MSFLVPKEVKDAAEKIGNFADELTETVKTYREIGQTIGGRIDRILGLIERGIEAVADAASEQDSGK